MAKYVFVTGGVTSSLGKGITAASIGRLLKARGLAVAAVAKDLERQRQCPALTAGIPLHGGGPSRTITKTPEDQDPWRSMSL
jgi:hypothetical protein